jgi:hypothetical protein
MWRRLTARRRRKAHEQYLREKERQKALNAQDVQQAVRSATNSSGASQQAFFGGG